MAGPASRPPIAAPAKAAPAQGVLAHGVPAQAAPDHGVPAQGVPAQAAPAHAGPAQGGAAQGGAAQGAGRPLGLAAASRIRAAHARRIARAARIMANPERNARARNRRRAPRWVRMSMASV